MADSSKPFIFIMICTGVLFINVMFLVLNVQYEPADESWTRRAYYLFFAALFVWCNIAWILYKDLWDDWHRSLTWNMQSFQVVSISTISNVVVAPIISYVHQTSGATNSFMWVLRARSFPEYEDLVKTYHPGYAFTAYQNPDDLLDIHRTLDTNYAALLVAIFFLILLFLIWGHMVLLWTKIRIIANRPLLPLLSPTQSTRELLSQQHQPPPPDYSERAIMEETLLPMIETPRSSPPSYTEEVIVTLDAESTASCIHEPSDP